MVRLQALDRFPWGLHYVDPGEILEASDADAAILIATGKAEALPTVTKPVAPKPHAAPPVKSKPHADEPKRDYKRRDMKAED